MYNASTEPETTIQLIAVPVWSEFELVVVPKKQYAATRATPNISANINKRTGQLLHAAVGHGSKTTIMNINAICRANIIHCSTTTGVHAEDGHANIEHVVVVVVVVVVAGEGSSVEVGVVLAPESDALATTTAPDEDEGEDEDDELVDGGQTTGAPELFASLTYSTLTVE